MSHLRQHAERILEAARGEPAQGEWTVFLNYQGGWEMIAGVDWPPDALAAERGAREVFQLRRRDGLLELEARETIAGAEPLILTAPA